MKTLKTLLIALVLVTPTACNKNEADQIETIHINPLEASEQVNLSGFVDSIKYIKLQTSPDCMLGKVPILSMGNKYIYALESKQSVIFIFDKSGKRVAKLDRYGQGPGEYNEITGVFIDPNDQYIEITDENKLLKFAVPNLELLEEKPLKDIIYGTSMRKFEGAYYYATNQFDNLVNGEMTNADVIVVKDGKLKTLFDKNLDLNGQYHMPFTEGFTINDENELFVSLKFDNTFYQLQKREAAPVLKVDFGNYGLDNSIGSRPGNEQIDFLSNSKNVASFPVLNINNTNILGITYFFTKSSGQTLPYQYFRLNQIRKIIHTKSLFNDLTPFPAYIDNNNNSGNTNHESWHNKYLVSIVWPHETITEDSVYIEGLGTITPDDNPVIVLMKLKNN